METIFVFAFLFLIVFGKHLTYAYKLWLYFKMNEAFNNKPATRIQRKPRKPARPRI